MQRYEAKLTADGVVFYLDHQTQQTFWEDPRPLPAGWRKEKTDDNLFYYLNDMCVIF